MLICCGKDEEANNRNGFLVNDDDELTYEYDDKTMTFISRDKKSGAIVHRESSASSSREKAAVALTLKHANTIHAAFPMNDVDDAVHYISPVHTKTLEEEDFIRNIMKNHMLFEDLNVTELQELVMATEKIQVMKDEKLVQQNQKNEDLYIVQHGILDVYCEVGEHSFGKLSDGNVYGEIGLLYGFQCPQTVIADIQSTLWRLDQHTFRCVRAKHAIRVDADIKNSLRKVEIFQNIPEHSFVKIAASLTRVSFQEGDRIINKGEIGETFYIIEEGSVKVHDIGIGDSRPVDQILKQGDVFGERALLTGEPRVANITALSSSVSTYAMDRKTFNENIGELFEMMEFGFKLQTIKGIPILANSDLTQVEFERLAGYTISLSYRKGSKLAEAGQPYPSSIWMLRKGRVLVYGAKSEHIYNLQAGDYFGDKTILRDRDHISSHDATCEENIDAWVLSKDDIECVIGDLNRLGRAAGFIETPHSKAKIQMRELKKHRILGRGAFGKVWLVTEKTTMKPYALKVINKRKLLDSKLERTVLREKELLSLLHHPFILHNESSFQDAANLYLVMPLIQGGELFKLVSAKSKGLPNFDAAFYACGIIEALGHFHHRFIAYRDLKLENVMIDSDGYIKIVDLGFAKVVVEKTFTFCGTPDYIAPEIIMSKGHNHGVDYWSYGVLVFELLTGSTPFTEPVQIDMYKRILLGQYSMPNRVDEDGKDLITKLLQRNVTSRLGMLKGGYHDIRDHPFFAKSGIEYRRLLRKEIRPPWSPNVKDSLDSHNFDKMKRAEREKDTGTPLSDEEQAIFQGF